MKTSILLMSVLSAFASAQTAAAPDYSKQIGTAADGKFRASQIPGLTEAYLPPVFASSHASNLLVQKSGDVLCTWFSGSWEGNSDVGIMLSRLPKGSRQWTSPQRIDHEEGKSFQNPVLFETPQGELWIIHTTQGAGQGQANARVLITKSSDHGKTWTAPSILFDQPGAFVRQPLVVLPNGNWLLPMYFTPSRGITTGAEANYSVVQNSSDQGAHWKECRIPGSDGYVQPGVVRLNNGRFIAFFRSRFADWIYKSDSTDGCTWTQPVKTQLPNNNSSMQAAKLKNGHLVMAFNNSQATTAKGKPQTAPRKPLSVALSEDGGETWTYVRDIDTGVEKGAKLPSDPIRKDQPGREEYSYPSITQSPDGRILVAYTYRRLTIKVVEFTENWIKEGQTTGLFKGDSKPSARDE